MKKGNNLSLKEESNTPKKLKARIEKEQDWVKAIAEKMGVPGRTDLAYRALIAVLHSVRDELDLKQVFQLSAYLPCSIRGIYFEGYDSDNVKVMLYNNQLLMGFRNRMGPGNSRYFEKYLNQYGKKKINGEVLLGTIREKLKAVKGVNADIAFQAVIEVIYEKTPFEEANVNNIKNLLDQNTTIQIAD